MHPLPPLHWMATIWAIEFQSGAHIEVREGQMLYTLRIFHIEGVVSQLVLHGIVVLVYPVESGDAGYIGEPPSLDL